MKNSKKLSLLCLSMATDLYAGELMQHHNQEPVLERESQQTYLHVITTSDDKKLALTDTNLQNIPGLQTLYDLQKQHGQERTSSLPSSILQPLATLAQLDKPEDIEPYLQSLYTEMKPNERLLKLWELIKAHDYLQTNNLQTVARLIAATFTKDALHIDQKIVKPILNEIEKDASFSHIGWALKGSFAQEYDHEPVHLSTITQPIDHNTLRNIFLSPNGSLLVTHSSDKIIVYNINTNKIIYTTSTGSQDSHQKYIEDVFFSADGSLLVTHSSDKVIVHDTKTGQSITTISNSTDIDSICKTFLSPDGLLLAIESFNKVVIYDMQKKNIRHTTTKGEKDGHQKEIERSFFSPRGSLFVTQSNDAVLVYNTITNKIIYTATKGEKDWHQKEIEHSFFNPDDSLLFTQSDDTVLVHKIDSHEIVCSINLKVPDNYQLKSSKPFIKNSLLNCDNSLLAMCSDHVILYNFQTDKVIFSIEKRNIKNAFFSPDGCLLVTHSFDTVIVHDIKTNQPIYSTSQGSQDGHTKYIENAFFSPDGCLLVTHSFDTVIAHDIKTNQPIYSTTKNQLNGHTEYILNTFFSPDGSLLVTRSFDTVIAHDIKTNQPIYSTTRGSKDGHKEDIKNAFFSPDGSLLVTHSWDRVIVHDIKTNQRIYSTTRGSKDGIWNSALSSDSSLLRTESSLTFKVHALPLPLTNGNIVCTNTIQDNRLTIQCKKYYSQEIAETFSLGQLYHLIKVKKLGLMDPKIDFVKINITDDNGLVEAPDHTIIPLVWKKLEKNSSK